MNLDMIVRNARLQSRASVDVGIAAGRIACVEPRIAGEAEIVDVGGRLVVPGFVETHLHLDKACILDRCHIEEGTPAEAVRLTAAAKRDFTFDDIGARGSRLLDKCITQGTTRIRTHVEVDPGIGLLGVEAVQQLAADYAWAVDIELCVFPQEGLLNNPGTDALMVAALARGARVVGAAPYFDSNPRGQIDRVFEIARAADCDIDMHLDLGDTTDGMQAEYVCRKTEEYRYGGRVAIGHVTQLSLLPPDRFAAIARQLANAGVAVTVLPATDLFLTGRLQTHAKPRGVVHAAEIVAHGANCSISTNNVLNPFTPFGDASLIRMANLYANVCQVSQPVPLAECLTMVTSRAARLMRLQDYGIAPGNPADLVVLDAYDPALAVAEIVPVLWGMKGGRRTVTRARPILHKPTGDVS
ncbi:MAG: amidohydrolase family protein [Alphaproteobacteria bacterium]|nr:amidohydrolase family protein [Alphaproteobacteria bacterium]